jgi:hypothetical protein
MKERKGYIFHCDVVGKPLKKSTTDQAAPGLEPGTSRMQSSTLDAWPQCSVCYEENNGFRFKFIKTVWNVAKKNTSDIIRHQKQNSNQDRSCFSITK